MDDPQHKTKDTVWSEFHRIQVAFHPGGAPVDVAREMRDTVVDLMTHDELKPAAGVEALEKLRLMVDRDRWMAEDSGSDKEPEFQWLLDAVMGFRHKDARAVQDNTARPDLDKEVYGIEQHLGFNGPPLDVRLLLGSAAARAEDHARRLRNAAAIDALERGRADFVAAAGEWVNNPPALRKARNGIEARSLPPGSSRR
ncbi:hypothetical protein [Streptomyces sp. NPDC046182]|uniref:hypothetical protein n=1 Tax=Streptomyces sp. NPDC046182 TaxID=3154601 RepID=UPI0033FD1E17